MKEQSIVLRAVDSSGLPVTAFAYNEAGIDLWYRRKGEAKVTITPVSLASLETAITPGGVKFIDDGYFRLDLPAAAVEEGTSSVQVGGSATDIVVIGVEIQIDEIGALSAGDRTKAWYTRRPDNV